MHANAERSPRVYTSCFVVEADIPHDPCHAQKSPQKALETLVEAAQTGDSGRVQATLGKGLSGQSVQNLYAGAPGAKALQELLGSGKPEILNIRTTNYVLNGVSDDGEWVSFSGADLTFKMDSSHHKAKAFCTNRDGQSLTTPAAKEHKCPTTCHIVDIK